MLRILLIDEDEKTRSSLPRLLPASYRVQACTVTDFTLDDVRSDAPDIVILDPSHRFEEGIRLIKTISTLPYPPPIIVYSSVTSPQTVVAAMHAGAHDYLGKPSRAEDIRNSVASAMAYGVSFNEADASAENEPLDLMLGDSRGIQRLKTRIVRFAPAPDPVLILGESGTGKELTARIVHEMSSRRTGPFIARNCAAIPESIFEAEMFGVERGAYTDAIARPGSFELAHEGTLFLDEIGEMSLNSQTKLLRALEDKEITRVGSRHPRRVNTRIIAATNRNLKQAVADGVFRRDLFYRVTILTMTVPPLRDRLEDLPVLAAHFLTRFDGGRCRLSKEAIEKLLAHPWPGNVRELYGTLRRASLLCDGSRVEARHITFL